MTGDPSTDDLATARRLVEQYGPWETGLDWFRRAGIIDPTFPLITAVHIESLRARLAASPGGTPFIHLSPREEHK